MAKLDYLCDGRAALERHQDPAADHKVRAAGFAAAPSGIPASASYGFALVARVNAPSYSMLKFRSGRPRQVSTKQRAALARLFRTTTAWPSSCRTDSNADPGQRIGRRTITV
jgi:hypothetical protein